MITISRTGPEPAPALDALIRADVGAEVMHHQDRLTRAALARGDLLDNAYTRTLRIGSTARTVENYESITRWPMPDYSTITAATASGVDLLAAAREAVKLFERAAPKTNRQKNHPYRYSQSLFIAVNGHELRSLPSASSLTGNSVITLTNVAPHASTLEADRRIMATIARSLIADFPALAISFQWITSDTVGRRYGKGTGGPSKGGAIYALPQIEIKATGTSRIAVAKRASRRRFKRR